MSLPPETRDPKVVRHYFEEALVRDPMNVASRIDYADALVKLGDPAEAAKQYREALRRNDLFDPTEPKRLTSDRVEQLQELVGQLERSK